MANKRGRRYNNEGSVYKRGNTYAGLLPYLDPASGTTKRMYFSGKTPDEVIKKMDTAKAERLAGTLTSESKILFKDWLKTWLEDYQEGHIKPSTYSLYEYLARVHIIPALGDLTLSKIQTSRLQKLYKTKRESGRVDGGGGLSTQTIHHMNKVIRGALAQAVAEGKISRNPAENVKLPRMERKPIQPLTKEQVTIFLDGIKDDWLYPVYLMTLGTGLRRGEILGLRWKDINLEAETVTVKRELLFINGKQLMQDGTKTAGSKSTVTMPDMVADTMKKHKTHQSEAMLALGHKLKEKDLVFTWASGDPISPNYVYHHFKELLTNHNLPNIRFHDLRHTFATLLLEEGIHPKIVADMLRHGSVRTTLDTYSHVSADMQARAAARLGEVLKSEEVSKE